MEQFKVLSDGIYRDISSGNGTMMLVMPKDVFKQAYEEYICDSKVTELKNMPLSKIQAEAFDAQYKKLDEEFEETIRGELMNLKLVQKHLLSHIHSISTLDMDEDISRAIKIIDSDVANLEKFVEERYTNE